jgi:hypothetical protein
MAAGETAQAQIDPERLSHRRSLEFAAHILFVGDDAAATLQSV